VALAALCLLAQLASFAHLGLVRHVTCPEHGELVHADADAPAGSVWQERSQSALPSYGAVPTETSAHGHDHCLCTTVRRERWAPQQAHLGFIAQSERRIVSHAGDLQPGASFPLFMLAPKNSPPA
jgi:hypothetical protein